MDREDLAEFSWRAFIVLFILFLILKIMRYYNLQFFSGIDNLLVIVMAFIFLLKLILSVTREKIKEFIYFAKMDLKIKKHLLRRTPILPVINSAFQILLIFYLTLLLINEFKEITFLNLNYLLIVVIVLGVLTVLFYKPKEKTKQRVTKSDYYLIYFLGILGTIIIYIKIKPLGWLSYPISIIAGILIILLSHLVLEEEDEKPKPSKRNLRK